MTHVGASVAACGAAILVLALLTEHPDSSTAGVLLRTSFTDHVWPEKLHSVYVLSLD